MAWLGERTLLHSRIDLLSSILLVNRVTGTPFVVDAEACKLIHSDSEFPSMLLYCGNSNSEGTWLEQHRTNTNRTQDSLKATDRLHRPSTFRRA